MSLRSHIERWSDSTEFWAVIVVAFGTFIATSTYRLFVHHVYVMSDRLLIFGVAFEILILTFVLSVGYVRGWSLDALGVRPSWKRTLNGALLFAATIAMTIAIAVVVAFFGSLPTPPITSRNLSWLARFAFSLINGFFEETIVVGYIIRATERRGPAFAILVSALVRLLYHTYQGPAALVSILPIGLLFAVVYWRWRELWPLIVAHALLDFMALSR